MIVKLGCCCLLGFFYHSALLETPTPFLAFSAQEARYRVKILTGCQGSKGVVPCF